ncbi:hypothetical protein GUJ93_ZPchr0001g29961 [Zizania palustris]|uniref:Uncharacterized protein n=1 Tax=Zizania palustris TaxID=103762 RepID=A0A8J5S0R1_ZIZPA|nr:hypothetical protein GUJ93_ZPchr0001g29961 [Zizania palustris]
MFGRFDGSEAVMHICRKNFTIEELVILYDAHAISVGHCSSLHARLTASPEHLLPSYRISFSYLPPELTAPQKIFLFRVFSSDSVHAIHYFLLYICHYPVYFAFQDDNIDNMLADIRKIASSGQLASTTTEGVGSWNNELWMHVSKPPENPYIKQIFEDFSNVSKEKDVSVGIKRKKINVSNPIKDIVGRRNGSLQLIE